MKLGGRNIKAVMLGDRPVQKVMLGDRLVWETDGEPGGDEQPIFAAFDVASATNSVNQRGNEFVANAAIVLTRVRVITGSATTLEFRVWDVATQALLHTENFTTTGTLAWEEFELAAPVAIQSGAHFVITVIGEATDTVSLRTGNTGTLVTAPQVAWVQGRQGSTSPNTSLKRLFPATQQTTVYSVDAVFTA